MDCCIPWFLLSKDDLDKCNLHPGKSHRCGGCDSGLMCNVYKTCNAFTKTELMIDDYGKLVMILGLLLGRFFLLLFSLCLAIRATLYRPGLFVPWIYDICKRTNK